MPAEFNRFFSPDQSLQKIHPLRDVISGSLSQILNGVNIPPEGTGVETLLETAYGDVTIDYDKRAIIVPPELYLRNPV